MTHKYPLTSVNKKGDFHLGTHLKRLYKVDPYDYYDYKVPSKREYHIEIDYINIFMHTKAAYLPFIVPDGFKIKVTAITGYR